MSEELNLLADGAACLAMRLRPEDEAFSASRHEPGSLREDRPEIRACPKKERELQSGQVILRDLGALFVRHALLERYDPKIVAARPGGADIELEPRFKKSIVQSGIGEPCFVRHIDFAFRNGISMPVQNIYRCDRSRW